MIVGSEIQVWGRRMDGFTSEAAVVQVNEAMRNLRSARGCKAKGWPASFYVQQARTAWRNAREWQRTLRVWAGETR
jgi:hypothetical protein